MEGLLAQAAVMPPCTQLEQLMEWIGHVPNLQRCHRSKAPAICMHFAMEAIQAAATGISKALAVPGESSTACHSPQLGDPGLRSTASSHPRPAQRPGIRLLGAEGIDKGAAVMGVGRASVGTDVLRSQRATGISRDQQAAAPCQLDR